MRDKWQTNPVLRDLAIFYDGGDKWGSVMSAWFAVCDVLYFECKDRCPSPSWDYRPGDATHGIDPENAEAAEILAGLRDGTFTEDDIFAAGEILCDEAETLRDAGEDY